MDKDIKDNNPQKDSHISVLKYNPELFHNDSNIYLIYRKIQNINAALFLVTNMLSDTELLKQSIRQQALNNLSTVSSIVGAANLNVVTLQVAQSQIFQIVSLLDVAFWTGLISEMNLNILKAEIGSVSSLLDLVIQKYKTNFLINATFFKADMSELAQPSISTHSYQGQVNASVKRHDAVNSLKDMTKHKDTAQPLQRSSEKSSQNKSERKQVILNLLSQKSNLSIKDFSAVITEFSEKTIQRELLALVDEGIVKKEGERRWSTYSLAQ
jgi:hypothetical protein